MHHQEEAAVVPACGSRHFALIIITRLAGCLITQPSAAWLE
jgi:hypothetical protein